MRTIIVSTLAIGMLTFTAQAEITVSEAQYAGGVLVVRGETSTPHQQVSLDRRYFKRSNKFKEFVFRVRYLPNDCTIKLRAGRDVQPALVRGCVSTDALEREAPVHGSTEGQSR
jgi:hypothetical protein